ncbi:MAG: metalloregulator ArsR/SmtB family transcription factor [Candidatus Thermoplasmatota archaeon]|nr:metalloregulator ArsR/SmtB family transcription factor [Candidatus Thermoplasmatota archaeon]
MIRSEPQYPISRIAEIFKVLGDQNRLHILSLISNQELCVCEITSIIGMSQSNASQHLAKLRSAGLVKERRSAQWIYYSLNQEALPLIKEVLKMLPDVSHELERLKTQPDRPKCDT